MAKWIKNVSGETRSFVGTEVTDGSFHQISASKEIAFMENASILSWVANGDAQMSEDGSTVITDPGVGIQFLNGYQKVRDTDGAEMTRIKMFKSGVAVRFHFFSFKTSDLTNGVYHKKLDGETNLNWITYKIFDSNGDEITDAENESQATRTTLDWEPTSINYEIVGGKFYQTERPAGNVYCWVVGVPDVPEAYGGSIPFCNSTNLKIMSSGMAFETDGRVPKSMIYDATNHTSKLRFIFEHGAGIQHECMGQLEIAY